MKIAHSFFLLILFFAPACSGLQKYKEHKIKFKDSIPLEVFSKGNGFHANIKIFIDGHLTKILNQKV